MEKFKVSSTREALYYHESSDTRVAAVGITVRTGRKYDHMTWPMARLVPEEVTAGIEDVRIN